MSASLTLHRGMKKIFVHQESDVSHKTSDGPYSITSIKVYADGQEVEIILFAPGGGVPEIIHTDKRDVPYGAYGEAPEYDSEGAA